MNNFLSNLKISTKLSGAFAIILLILIITGFVNYFGISSVNSKTNDIIQTAPLVDAAMEIKVAVSRDMQIIMELLASKNEQQLNQVWQQHEEYIKTFDIYAMAILDGAETKEGIIYAATDEKLRQIVIESEEFHNKQFLPAIKQVYDISKAIFNKQKDRINAMREFEVSFNKIINIAEQTESQIKTAMGQKLAQDLNNAYVLRNENLWADLIMEIKTTIAISRIKIEEYAQLAEIENQPQLITEYKQLLVEFDGWINALLNGGETSEGHIVAITDEAIRNAIIALETIHESEFQSSAAKFITLQTELQNLLQERSEFDNQADKIGEIMLADIDGIEHIAKEDMHIAAESAVSTTTNVQTTVIASLFFGFIVVVILAVTITASIIKPLGGEPCEMLQIAEKVSSGDLTEQFDDIPDIKNAYRSLQRMSNSLRDLITDIIDTSIQLASSATEAAAVSKQMNAGMGNQQEATTQVASAMEQMLASVKSVSSEVADTVNVAKTSQVAGKSGKEVITQTIDEIEVLSSQINSATNIIYSLGEKTDSISSVSEVISGIADQTNLLALNAAIEAARAGEQGRGFAVVADEVRMLAQKTQESTKSIQQIITELQTGSSDAVSAMDSSREQTDKTVEQAKQAGAVIETILQGIDSISSSSDQIAIASTEQAIVTENINQNIQDINIVAMETATGSTQIEKESMQLSQLANNLQAMVSKFSI